MPRGYLFSATEAGLRTHGTGPDVALMYSTFPARVGALFTTNRVKAAPVLLSQKNLRDNKHTCQAILVNAGNANCSTGPQGMQTAKACVRRAADLLGLKRNQVLAASTGVIGVPLDAAKITGLLPSLVRRLHPEGYKGASKAILTTDRKTKVASRSLMVDGSRINILGFSKGAGMIYPRMATMLGFFFTDAAVEPRFLQSATRRMTDLSFHRISVDGDTSTNDSVFVMANGQAKNTPIRARTREAEKFLETLTELAQELAIRMVKDGEGAKKVAEIRVMGARTEAQAEAIARAIGLSPLVKTTLAGADPNWGRILSAAGNAGVPLNPDRVDIYINRMLVFRAGAAAEFDEAAAVRQLRKKSVLIRVVIGKGSAQVRFWTCDFTEEYVRINAEYRT